MKPAELKKLIKICRELGVKSYKGEGFEFILTDEAPPSKQELKAFPNTGVQQETIESDALTPEQLLFYSAMTPFDSPIEANE